LFFQFIRATRKMVEQFDLMHHLNSGDQVKGIWLTEPLGYLEFLHLNMNAKMVLTDSGGLQEETTVLGVPCITMRHNTERPITCEVGTNVIVGNSPDKILSAARAVLAGEGKKGAIPEKWDGRAAERIVEWLVSNSSD
jgi:UDP-N-acetylglucosamine 2-epimerase (non-hydrolysing)